MEAVNGESFLNPIQQYMNSIKFEIVRSNEEVDAQDKAYLDNQRKSHFQSCGVDSRYLDVDWSDFDKHSVEAEGAFNEVRKFADDVNFGIFRNLWICGGNGTGKTHLASLALKECFGTYTESPRIEDEIEETKHFKSEETLSGLTKRYSGYKLLAIDEVGRFPGDAEKKYLFKILNARYNAMRPTILVTNMSKKELKQYLGNALVDRFNENCTAIELNGESYRKKLRNV